MGPSTVIRDRIDYAGSIGESWKTQMLFNPVKLPYGDIPVFMDVGQVVAGYSMQRAATVNGSFNIFNQGPPPTLSQACSAGPLALFTTIARPSRTRLWPASALRAR